MNAAYASKQQVQEWLADRQSGIGSSDASAVAGCNPYKSALEVYMHLVDGSPATGELPDDPLMLAGLVCEPAVARFYELETGVGLATPKPRTHPKYPWMKATADRVRVDSHGEPTRIVELKTASVYAKGWGEHGTDEVPEWYIIQVQHQMAVFGLDVADIACLIGGNDFRIYPIERNESIINSLIEIESAFWKRVEDRNPPDPDWMHPNTVKLLNQLHIPAPGKSIKLPGDSLTDVDNWIDAKARLKEANAGAKVIEAECKQHQARIIAAMHDAEVATIGGHTITRKTIDRDGYTVQPCSYVDMRVKSPKGK